MLPQKTYHRSIKRPDWTQSTERDPSLLWLDKNENIDPAYNALVAEWVKALPPEAAFGYPDGSHLYRKLANSLAIDANNLIFAAGSDGVIRLAYEAFLSPGDKVLYPTPTFAMYAIYAQMAGAETLTVNYHKTPSGPRLDMEAFIHLIRTERPKLVCLPNPDSPTGTVIEPAVLASMLNAAKSVDAVVLIDEAYYPFYDQTVMPWVKQYDNLLVTRTFSKAWGLAGARLGFAAGNQRLVTMLHRLRPMYEVGTLSVSLIEMALDNEQAMLASVERTMAGKRYFQEAMRRLGFDVIDQVHGNFMHIGFGSLAQSIHQALETVVLYRKDFPHTALAGYSRFSATTQALFAPVVDIIEKVAVAHHQKEAV